MKKAIVSGANGFVGGAVVQELLANGYCVYALCQAGCENVIPDNSNLETVVYELAVPEDLLKFIPIGEYDVFFHFAWAGSAGAARADSKLQLQNAQWTVEAMQVAQKLGCKRFVPAGSIMEHETMAAAYMQGNRPGLGYIYGAGKLVAHVMCMSVAAQIGIDLIWPEITNAYGVGERSPRLVNTTIQKCIKGEEPQFTSGTQNYDFVYIDDVAKAFRLIAENGKPFHEYLIGSSTARPLKEFLLEMQQAVAPNLDFRFGDVPFTGVNLSLSKFDCSQTELDCGFKAEVGFAEGCKRTYEWWQNLLEEA